MILYIGLMSGTSMDGIDAALIDASHNTLVHGITKKYSTEVMKRIDDLNRHITLATLCQLNTLIGKEFASVANDLLKEAKLSSSDIAAIGSHGQTLCHNTQCDIPYTLQLGCGHTISSLTGITVVADFRTRDLVNGGQGAPFAPLYHHQLFSHHDEPVAVVNIGGIANITLIHENDPVKGWDIGPGNCLMDAWIMKHQGKAFDREGAWAQQGTLIEPLLNSLLSDSFLMRPTPKSIGKEYYSLLWLEAHLKQEYLPVDVQRTLLVFTAQAIANAVLDEKSNVNKIYICGGGAHNTALMQMLSALLPAMSVKSSAEVGVDPDFVEAMMFAWLAAQTINQIPVDLGAITGSQSPAILGAIYPAT